ncbi:hypothetical protein BUALT_Bualt02G0076600 [Buddleja alternifolia]|uniref:Protein FAR1-RELATED SEQUENCE n=1 Tax=Buddleja alternifolia TaxID=168488 RepID=A0AAV6XYE0_9LAMI|nr:hypothetical protein BUALT_Bualt02G0076600 [Buddleja alternifolia]
MDEKSVRNDVEAPELGLLFESYEAVYEFYQRYAIKEGFGITKLRSEPRDFRLMKSFSLACCKSVVVLDHNHELNPSISRMFRSNRKLDTPTKKCLQLNDRAGIRLSKTFNSFLFENGGHENMTFGEKDCRNYMDKLRRQLFCERDAQALLSYFMRM